MSTSTPLAVTVTVASGKQLAIKAVTRTRHVALPVRVVLAAPQTVTIRPVG